MFICGKNSGLAWRGRRSGGKEGRRERGWKVKSKEGKGGGKKGTVGGREVLIKIVRVRGTCSN